MGNFVSLSELDARFNNQKLDEKRKHQLVIMPNEDVDVSDLKAKKMNDFKDAKKDPLFL